MKDIFIDNNIASRFANPMDKEYKKLLEWLLTYHVKEANKKDNAFLAVSHKLIAEYNRSNFNASSPTSIPLIINILTQQGRLNHITNQAIKDFQKTYFTPKVKRKLQSNSEDREHIPVVLLSERKMALSIDDKFISDLDNFAGFEVKTAKRPEELDYKG
jgi:hypothetical protein